LPGSDDDGFSWNSKLFLQTARLAEFGFKYQVSRRRDSLGSAKWIFLKNPRNILSYTKIHNKVNTSKDLFRCAYPVQAKNGGNMGTQ
jgi:hypothetical protein